MFSSVCVAIASKLIASGYSVSVAKSSTGGLMRQIFYLLLVHQDTFVVAVLFAPANRDTPFLT